MELRALFVGVDKEAIAPIQRAMQKLGVDPEFSPSALMAAQLLQRKRFEAVVVDCDDLAGSHALIPSLRHGRSNRNAVVFALTNGRTTMREAYAMGANFVLEKPITPERAERSFRAAQGLLVRERRRYQRVRVHWHGELSGLGLPNSASVKIADISEGGCSVQLSRSASLQGAGNVAIKIPDLATSFEAKVEVTWKHEDGRSAGLKFVSVPTKSRDMLGEWLNNAFV